MSTSVFRLASLMSACHVPVIGGDPTRPDATRADHVPRQPARSFSAAHVPCSRTRFASIRATFPARRLAFSDRSPPSTSLEGRGCLPSPARIHEARVLAVARPHRTRHRTPSSPRAPFGRFARDVEEALVQPIALRRTVDGESRAPSPTSATVPSKTRSRRRLAPAPSSPHGLPPRADLGPTRRSRRRFAP
jgi:hypothetical protein